MFTGIVEELGQVVAVEAGRDSARVVLRGPLVTSDAGHGDSICVNGACLTVTSWGEGEFTADVMAETLQRTTLGGLRPGDRVNLERAVPAGGRLGGHVVQGHVDGVGRVLDRTPGDAWETVRFALPRALGRYVAEKGSIALDGVSLTVVAVEDADEETSVVTVGLIPTTLAATTVGRAAPGTPVNVEVDVVAKYVERLLGSRAAPAGRP
ncbi:riboflavin synthase [Quadrisphaera sp. DSM 44207]|uniref:riboflavin synthase n=1 Tax=Quadrisphaera sp. DSM 44207 TaxID=1881057 RepID=UPI0008883718|nr:riboflavin synthase [Quadrisphaera sp. DSM 44207]SDQ77092.1 riboflavin synthase alpha chain [Quadrisphaera sp. DSM 44207]